MLFSSTHVLRENEVGFLITYPNGTAQVNIGEPEVLRSQLDVGR